MKRKMEQYAASGSCNVKTIEVIGKVKSDNRFVSNEFSGSMNDSDFWDRLGEFARTNNAYVRLMF